MPARDLRRGVRLWDHGEAGPKVEGPRKAAGIYTTVPEGAVDQVEETIEGNGQDLCDADDHAFQAWSFLRQRSARMPPI